MQDTKIYNAELTRICHGVNPDDSIPGIGTVCFIVRCDGNADRTLRAAKDTMIIISQACADGWPSNANWQTLLPTHFVQACTPELTQAEANAWLAQWQAMTPAEKEQEEKAGKWSLDSWLHWLKPAERSWLWWDATLLDENNIRLAVAVMDWPFPWGALSWLFRASGAIEVILEE